MNTEENVDMQLYNKISCIKKSNLPATDQCQLGEEPQYAICIEAFPPPGPNHDK